MSHCVLVRQNRKLLIFFGTNITGSTIEKGTLALRPAISASFFFVRDCRVSMCCCRAAADLSAASALASADCSCLCRAVAAERSYHVSCNGKAAIRYCAFQIRLLPCDCMLSVRSVCSTVCGKKHAMEVYMHCSALALWCMAASWYYQVLLANVKH